MLLSLRYGTFTLPVHKLRHEVSAEHMAGVETHSLETTSRLPVADIPVPADVPVLQHVRDHLLRPACFLSLRLGLQELLRSGPEQDKAGGPRPCLLKALTLVDGFVSLRLGLRTTVHNPQSRLAVGARLVVLTAMELDDQGRRGLRTSGSYTLPANGSARAKEALEPVLPPCPAGFRRSKLIATSYAVRNRVDFEYEDVEPATK